MTVLAAVTVVMLSGCASHTPSLHGAAMSGDVNTARSLIESGADMNAKDEHGSTPLEWAFMAEKTEAAKLLINKGADISARDVNGWTFLHQAASRKGFIEIAEALINKGADVNARDNWGGTPLRVAAQHGNMEIAKLLISKGADVNAKDKNGTTPLMVAKTAETANLLVSKGADANARHKDGKTAVEAQRDYMKQVSDAKIAYQQKAAQQKQEELAQQRQQAAEQQRQQAIQQQRQAEQQQQQAASEQAGSGNPLMGMLGSAYANHVGSKISSSGIAGSKSKIVGDTVSSMGAMIQSGQSVSGDAIANQMGVNIMNRTAAAVKADNTAGSRVLGDTMSNMATQVRNNDTSGTLGSAIADAAGASIRDNTIGMATAKLATPAKGGISGSSANSANSGAGTQKLPPSVPGTSGTGGSNSGTSALIGRWVLIGTYWGSGPAPDHNE